MGGNVGVGVSVEVRVGRGVGISVIVGLGVAVGISVEVDSGVAVGLGADVAGMDGGVFFTTTTVTVGCSSSTISND